MSGSFGIMNVEALRTSWVNKGYFDYTQHVPTESDKKGKGDEIPTKKVSVPFGSAWAARKLEITANNQVYFGKSALYRIAAVFVAALTLLPLALRTGRDILGLPYYAYKQEAGKNFARDLVDWSILFEIILGGGVRAGLEAATSPFQALYTLGVNSSFKARSVVHLTLTQEHVRVSKENIRQYILPKVAASIGELQEEIDQLGSTEEYLRNKKEEFNKFQANLKSLMETQAQTSSDAVLLKKNAHRIEIIQKDIETLKKFIKSAEKFQKLSPEERKALLTQKQETLAKRREFWQKLTSEDSLSQPAETELSARLGAIFAIDIQKDFLPNGALAVADGHEVVPPTNRLLERAVRMFRGSTFDWHSFDNISFAANAGGGLLSVVNLIVGREVMTQMKWATHCVKNSTGAGYAYGLKANLIQREIFKGERDVDSYSGVCDNRGRVGGEKTVKAFDEREHADKMTRMIPELRAKGITDVVLTGLAYDYCVGSTAEDLLKAGFRVTIVLDATKSIADDSAIEMTERLLQAGCLFATSEQLLTGKAYGGAEFFPAPPTKEAGNKEKAGKPDEVAGKKAAEKSDVEVETPKEPSKQEELEESIHDEGDSLGDTPSE